MIGPRAAARVAPRGGVAISPIEDELANAFLLIITVLPINPIIGILGSVQMAAFGTYSNNTTINITAVVAWSTVLTLIATVLGGLVAGVSLGTTQVRASLSGVTGQTNVTVSL